MTRAVEGLRFADRVARPPCIGKSKPRGAKAHGVRYENSLAKALRGARHGQWFQFMDSNGLGYCQTDLLLEFEKCVVVLEAKYTWTPEGHFQVERLYAPVVSKAMGKPTFGLVICRALLDDMPGVMVLAHLSDALLWAQRKRVALHWLGGENFLKLPENLGPQFGALIRANTIPLVLARKAG